MTFSSLVGRTVATTKQGPRYGKRVERLIVHHCDSTNNEAMVRYLSGSGGGTSATYCLTTGPELVGIVPEELRPWTSNAIVGGVNYDNDSNSVTVETVNLTRAPDWLVSEAQLEVLAQLAADLCKRYGWGKLDRNRVVGHREVLPKGYTECPGPYLYAHLDWIVERGNEILNPTEKRKRKDIDMLGMMGGDGQGRYGPKNEQVYVIYDGRALVFVNKNDGDPLSVYMNDESFAEVSYHAIDGYIAAAETVVDARVNPPKILKAPPSRA